MALRVTVMIMEHRNGKLHMIHQQLRSTTRQEVDLRCTQRRACTEVDLNKSINPLFPGELQSDVLNGWMERECQTTKSISGVSSLNPQRNASPRPPNLIPWLILYITNP